MNLSACRLAVLGGCATGEVSLGTLPDEMPSLATAALEAGAAGVISTLWPVAARATHAALTELFDHLLSCGLAPANALRAVQRAMPESQDRAALSLMGS